MIVPKEDRVGVIDCDKVALDVTEALTRGDPLADVVSVEESVADVETVGEGEGDADFVAIGDADTLVDPVLDLVVEIEPVDETERGALGEELTVDEELTVALTLCVVDTLTDTVFEDEKDCVGVAVDDTVTVPSGDTLEVGESVGVGDPEIETVEVGDCGPDLDEVGDAETLIEPELVRVDEMEPVGLREGRALGEELTVDDGLNVPLMLCVDVTVTRPVLEGEID